jgi:hypothetical protein
MKSRRLIWSSRDPRRSGRSLTLWGQAANGQPLSGKPDQRTSSETVGMSRTVESRMGAVAWAIRQAPFPIPCPRRNEGSANGIIITRHAARVGALLSKLATGEPGIGWRLTSLAKAIVLSISASSSCCLSDVKTEKNLLYTNHP